MTRVDPLGDRQPFGTHSPSRAYSKPAARQYDAWRALPHPHGVRQAGQLRWRQRGHKQLRQQQGQQAARHGGGPAPAGHAGQRGRQARHRQQRGGAAVRRQDLSRPLGSREQIRVRGAAVARQVPGRSCKAEALRLRHGPTCWATPKMASASSRSICAGSEGEARGRRGAVRRRLRALSCAACFRGRRMRRSSPGAPAPPAPPARPSARLRWWCAARPMPDWEAGACGPAGRTAARQAPTVTATTRHRSFAPEPHWIAAAHRRY
jgi:hypothetical protein